VPGEGMRLFIDDGSDVKGTGIRSETVAVCDQYTLEADSFSRAVRGEEKLVNSLEDTFGNTATLEALFRSAASGKWEIPERL
jgi:predicted dehydrogenase